MSGLEQRIELIQAACCVAASDGEISSSERRFLQRLAIGAGIDADALAVMIERAETDESFLDDQFRIAGIDPRKTMDVLFKLAIVDGKLRKPEAVTLRKLAGQMGITPDRFQKWLKKSIDRARREAGRNSKEPRNSSRSASTGTDKAADSHRVLRGEPFFKRYSKGNMTCVVWFAIAFIPAWALFGLCLFFLGKSQEASFMADHPHFQRTGGSYPYLCFTSADEVVDREAFKHLCEAWGQQKFRKGVAASRTKSGLLVFVLDHPVNFEYPVYREPRTEPYIVTVSLEGSDKQIGAITPKLGRKATPIYLKEPNGDPPSGEPDWSDIDYHLPVELKFLKPYVRAMYKGSHAGQPNSERYWFDDAR